MMYNMTLSMFTKEDVKGHKGTEGMTLLVQGKSPKGSFSFLCEEEKAKILYERIMFAIGSFIMTNEDDVYESFEEMVEEKKEEEVECNGRTCDACEDFLRCAHEKEREAHRKGVIETKEEDDLKTLVKEKYEVYNGGFDLVSKPSHYTEGRQYEPRKVIEDWDLDWNLGNTVKYISRAGRKENKVQDLEKARQYLDWAIEEAKR